MRFGLVLMLAVAAMGTCAGCGGVSQEDMKRTAIRRKKEVDEPSPPAAVSNPPGAPAAPAPPSPGTPPSATSAASTTPSPAQPGAASPPSVGSATNRPRITQRVSRPEEKPVLPLSDVERRAKSLQHLGAIAGAMQAYLAEHSGLPAPVISGSGGTPLLSWRVELLPYLGYQELYQKFHLDEPWDSSHNKSLVAEIPPEYQSPERFDDRTNYLVPIAPDAAFSGRRGSPKRRFEDGLANTVVLLEVDDDRAVPWTQPTDHAYQTNSPDVNTGKLRADGFFVAWGDGQLGRIPRGTNPTALRAIMTAAGGEDYARADVQQPATPEVAAGAMAVAARVRTNESIDPDDGGDQGAGAPKIAKKPPRPIATSRPAAAENEFDMDLDSEESSSNVLPTGDLADQAVVALAEGREHDAFQLYYGAALTSPPEDTWHEAMHWVPALQRPVLGIRWGFGVQYSGAPTASFAAVGRKAPASVSESGNGVQHLVGYGGELGEKMLEEMKFRLESGRWGAVYARGEDAPRSVRRVPVDPNVPVSRQVHNVAPGISYFGKGTRKELVHAANQEGVDVLLIFEIVAKSTPRSKWPLSNTSVVLVDAQRNKTLYSSPSLSNIKVLKQREDRLQEDPIKAWLDKYLAFVDENFLAEDLPIALTPEHVASRVATLAEAKYDNPLPALVEIRLYHDRRMIDEDQMRSAYQALLGERSGGRLLDGDEQQRREVLQKWLPRPQKGKGGAALTRSEDD